MNTYKALKEILPWAKPMYVEKAKIRRLIKLMETYMESNNPIIKNSIDRMMKDLKEG